MRKEYRRPTSNLISDETRHAIQDYSSYGSEASEELLKLHSLINGDNTKLEDISAIRSRYIEYFYKNDPLYKSHKSRYNVSVQLKLIAGIHAEIFTPEEGISQKNQQRILINLHGGGFLNGSRTSSHLESLPIASLGQIKVVSVDYRMAPEFQFPAASQDVANVYKELLQEYKPENIGIYGHSAGGLLAAESMAWFQNEDLPLPGAIGMFCGAAHFWMDGISGYFEAATCSSDTNLPCARDILYFKNIENLEDPLAFPGKTPKVLKRFPPSLLISATRDFALSSVVKTHSQLVRLGIDTDLHVWEGVDHSFICNSSLPECREAYNVVVNFFNNHLK